MMRRLLSLLLVPFVTFAVLSAARPAAAQDVVDELFSKPGYVGLLVRPTFCLDNCGDDGLISFGVEAGYKYIGLGVRYAYKDSTHYMFPDIRGYYDFHVVRNLTITPLIELSPMFSFGDSSKSLTLVVRPGVRIGYAPSPYMMIFLEPILVDLGFYSKTWLDGHGSVSTTDLVTRYSVGVGIQTRF